MRYRIVAFDFEVFATWWCVVFQELKTGKQVVVENDPQKLSRILSRDRDIFIGWNSKFYDQAIAKAICTGASNRIVKELNDWIIGEKQLWWEFWWFRQSSRFDFNTADVRDDAQSGLSLKSIEGHMHLPIIESSIPFDLERELTRAEKDEIVKYCKHDVSTTAKLIHERADYFRTKAYLGEMVGIPFPRAISLTNAKLVAAYLGARRKAHNDERVYDIPKELKQERIPSEVFEFFSRMDDPDLTDEEVFKSKLEIDFCDIPTVFAYGGVHGARPTYRESATSNRRVVLADVSSMYPTTMIKYDLVSRNIPDPDAFTKVVKERLEAKHKGDKQTAAALKLVTNTAYGAMLQEHNNLFDPRRGRSVCITGQLMLADLAAGLATEMHSATLIQLNTDGVMVSFDVSENNAFEDVCREWELRTGYELEYDEIDTVIQRDVNNYIVVFDDGKIKQKGGELFRGISKAGAWNINNTANVVARAVGDFLLDGTPVEDTVNRCHNTLDFQYIAKGGSKYRAVIHEVRGEEIEVQKVNRVYASKDKSLGTLRKIHGKTGSKEKIAGLPDHCVIDNHNQITIDRIDKDWYIDQAKKKIEKFIGG